MKFVWIFLILTLPVFAPKQSLVSEAESKLIDYLSEESRSVRQAWTLADIEQAALSLRTVKVRTGLSYDIQLRIIRRESRFNKYARNYNKGGHTVDVGLTQQNSKYWNFRCQVLWQRDCQRWDLYNPARSILLMGVHLKWCQGQFRGIAVLECYNRPARARRGVFTYARLL